MLAGRMTFRVLLVFAFAATVVPPRTLCAVEQTPKQEVSGMLTDALKDEIRVLWRRVAALGAPDHSPETISRLRALLTEATARATTPEEKARYQQTRAWVLLIEKRYLEAKQAFRELLDLPASLFSPDDRASILGGLGGCHRALGEWREALDIALEQAKQYPTGALQWQYKCHVAVCARHLGRYPEALKYLEILLLDECEGADKFSGSGVEELQALGEIFEPARELLARLRLTTDSCSERDEGGLREITWVPAPLAVRAAVLIPPNPGYGTPRIPSVLHVRGSARETYVVQLLGLPTGCPALEGRRPGTVRLQLHRFISADPVYARQPRGTDPTHVAVHAITAPWHPDRVSWSTRPTWSPEPIARLAISEQDAWVTVDLTAEWEKAASGQFHGIALLPDDKEDRGVVFRGPRTMRFDERPRLVFEVRKQ